MENYNDEIDLGELVSKFSKKLPFVLKWTFYAFVFSIIISLILPVKYKSSTKILLSKPSSTQGALASFLGGAGGIGELALGIKNYSFVYEAVVKSNSVIDYVIDKNNLFEVYEVEKDDKDILRQKILNNLNVSVDKKTNLLTLEYWDGDPVLCYNIVNSFIEGLKNVVNRLAITDASQKRLFYEEQLKIAKENLIKSEEALKRFQQKTGSIKLDEEAKAQIETLAMLRAKVIAGEAELKMMESYTTRENPQYKAKLDEVNALRQQLKKLQSKLPLDDEELLSTKKVSVEGIEYIRKMRDFKYNEAIYEILIKQYEMAKLEESMDASTIQIVDFPEIPIKKDKPKRKIIVIVFTISAFFGFIFFSFFKDFWNEMKKNNKYDFKRVSFNEIFEDVKADIRKIIRWVKQG